MASTYLFKVWAGATAFVVAATLIGGCGGGSTNLPQPTSRSSIVFSSDRDASAVGDFDIYRMNPDGSNVQRLTNNSPINDDGPALSPDGRKIVFTSSGRPTDGPNGSQIYLMNADGTQLQQLTDSANASYAPKWSPDGRKIVFGSPRDSLADVYIMDADGSNQTNLTGTQGGGGGGIFNGDGSKILFSSSRDINDPRGRTPANLYVMNSDGSNQKLFPLSGEPTPTNRFPSQFSPDGRRILFFGGPGFGGGGPAGIFVSNADGTDFKQILTGGFAPVWSPDGQRIAFGRSDGESSAEIFTAKADGTDVQQITNNTRLDSSPSWR